MYAGFFKRALDIIFALLATPFVLLATLFVAPAIFICDRGPVFYRAPRRGRDGKVFNMLKFRSMRVNAPEIRNSDGSVYTGRNDPRVTPVGRLLRKLSVDELPQIFNVLKGDMSFIGPRPHLATTDYEALDERRKKRLLVRPGITGYSQAYFRNSISAEEKIDNDCLYVDRISFLFDIKILIRTVFSVLARKNVYGSEQAQASDGPDKSAAAPDGSFDGEKPR